VIERYMPRKAVALIGGLALLGAIPYALANQVRPFMRVSYSDNRNANEVRSIFRVTRERLYFADHHLYLADSYIAAATAVAASGCHDVGLDVFLQHWDYPMLALLRAGLGGPTVRYVGVENRSTVYRPSTSSVPCVVVCLGCAFVRQKWDQYAGPNTSTLQFDRVVVFLGPQFATIPKYTRSAHADALRAVGQTETLVVDSRKPAKNGICLRLPNEVAAEVLGNRVAEESADSACLYNSAAGQMEIREFPAGSYYSEEFDELSLEGINSVVIYGGGYQAAVVRDRGVPAIVYLRNSDRTYSVSLDRYQPSPRVEELIRLAALVASTSPPR